MAGRENEKCIANLDSEVFVIKAEDSWRDSETGTCTVSIPDTTSLKQTANLPSKLILCVGARLMLTDNINISDWLINGSIGTVKYLHMKHNNPLLGKIYVKFDDPRAGNSLKDRRLPGELKECVPISATTKPSPFQQEKQQLMFRGNNFQLYLAMQLLFTNHKAVLLNT